MSSARTPDRIDGKDRIEGRLEDPPAIDIEVLLFAGVREAAGVARTSLLLPAPATAGLVVDALVARFPALAAHRGSLRLAVNSEYAGADEPLKNGDEVALIPPTCGG